MQFSCLKTRGWQFGPAVVVHDEDEIWESEPKQPAESGSIAPKENRKVRQ